MQDSVTTWVITVLSILGGAVAPEGTSAAHTKAKPRILRQFAISHKSSLDTIRISKFFFGSATAVQGCASVGGADLCYQVLPASVFSAAIFGKADRAARVGSFDGDAPMDHIGAHSGFASLVAIEETAVGQRRFERVAGRVGLRIDFIVLMQAGKAAAAAG